MSKAKRKTLTAEELAQLHHKEYRDWLYKTKENRNQPILAMLATQDLKEGGDL